ncbi:MAG TPA: hypothetical protein VFC46_02235, partial [Humisphaera sp.]|nr:hypothetical protein [Humisphaera sp.]
MDKQISEQIDEERKRASAQIMPHRQAMEALCDQLNRACLREPDVKAFTHAETLQKAVLWEATQGSVMNPNSIAGFKSLFVRTETNTVIDGMIREAQRRRSEIVEHQRTITALENQRPFRQLQARWNELAGVVQSKFGDAEKILSGEPASEVAVGDRADVERLIERIAADDQSRVAKTVQLQRGLGDLKQQVDEIHAATNDPSILKAAADGAAQITEVIARLQSSIGVDRKAVRAYHRQFLTNLPSSLNNLEALTAFGIAVTQAKSQAPAQW